MNSVQKPIPGTVDVRAFNHRLGESAMVLLASRSLARQCRARFPGCLDGMPLLLPGADSPMRGRILRWLGKHALEPRIVGEFDGSSLMSAFAEGGFGVFAAPSILEGEIRRRHDVVPIGTARDLVAEALRRL